MGFMVTQEGINTYTYKLRERMGIKSPQKKHQLRRFIGMVNFYRYLWKKRFLTFYPLSTMLDNTN